MKKLMLCIITLASLAGAALHAQDIAATWQGSVNAGGRELRTVVKISKADDGKLKGLLYSIDQTPQPFPANPITFQGSVLKFTLSAVDVVYEGRMSADGKTITGTWTQGGGTALPLILTRSTKETEWTIPEPPAKVAPMAADASPEFEVATIKPSKPDQPGKGYRIQPRKMSTINTSLDDLITFAYGLHVKQLTGAQPWMETDKYDIVGQPDLEGQPSAKQWKLMIQKLLVSRFKLTFHYDKKELSVYAITLAKTPQKMTRSEGDANAQPAMYFTQLGALTIRNATMKDFASVMQEAVLDRPVVDQTGLTGRFDFNLKWTPDETQFATMGFKVPPPTDKADAPPGLYAAIQEQVGLKLEPTKAPVELFVIDHVEKPSDN